VIAEAPSSSGGVLPLADFGRVNFSGATVNGAMLSSATPGLDPITMASGSTVEAVPHHRPLASLQCAVRRSRRSANPAQSRAAGAP
jgi:hypothetical protein